MKKISSVCLIFLLMISMIVTSFATESNTINNAVTENQETEVQDSGETIIDTIGKIVEVRGVKEVETGGVKDLVQDITVEITEGEYVGEEFETTYMLSLDMHGQVFAYELEVGDKVIVQLIEDADGNVTPIVQDVARFNYIILIFILFLFCIGIIGGKKGIKAIISLVFTIVCIYFILIKGIYKGNNAIIYSFLTAFIVVSISFIILNGFNRKTLTALVGSFGGIVISGILALIFNNMSKLSGAGEDIMQLTANLSTINYNFRDILFSGIIISTIGICMHVSISIVSALDEIKMKTPEITWKELFKDGMKVGKEIIGTTSNTLLLAYIGSLLTLILLFMSTTDSNLIRIINKENVAEQLISALSASIGVVLTIPITAISYAILNKDKVIYRKNSENRVNGKRSLKI
ncbi:MAG TPA: YibE/F family protein [Candidatus Scatovivens faecipullorum]|nr:YibE/F family protein [Candidatus Scatovivens faecipullorum]